jgi:hypothetical protein
MASILLERKSGSQFRKRRKGVGLERRTVISRILLNLFFKIKKREKTHFWAVLCSPSPPPPFVVVVSAVCSLST